MKLHIQALLDEYRSEGFVFADNAATIISKLSEEHGIECKDYPDSGVILLDYDQIDAPKSAPITIECRSLILDRTTYAVLSRKFDRFFNYGEMLEYYEDFSFEGSLVFEKADGSLVGVWYNPHTETYEISTRGMAFAEGEHPMGGTFRSRILKAFGFKDEADFQSRARDALIPLFSSTAIFEFCSPENRIVTPYAEDVMILLGMNHSVGYQYPSSLDFVAECMAGHGLNVRAPVTYTASSLKHAQELADGLPGMLEGFVVYDPKSNKRIKVKSTTYLVAHRLRGNDMIPTRKNILELVFEGDVAEMLSYFPEFEKYITPVQEEVNYFLTKVNQAWDENQHIEDQKEFAKAIMQTPGSSILFDARKYKRTPLQSWREFKLAAKMKLFGA